MRWLACRTAVGWFIARRAADPAGNATMRYCVSLISLLSLLPLWTGCRLPGREGPVPQSLSDCRRLSQQGMAALDRGEQPKAEVLLAKAVAACPIDAEARRYYAESLWRRDARADALAQLQAAGQLAPDDASLWARLAEMHLACGQTELALQTAEHALQLDSKSSVAWAVRGGAARAAGQPRVALNAYLRALSYTPNDRVILLEIAESHRELNQPEHAIQALQTLADTYSPGEEPGHIDYRMGLAYMALGRYADGAERFSTAGRDKPSAETYYHLGEAELLAGHPAAAAEAGRKALALDPLHQPSRELLDRVEVAQRPEANLRK
jgi:tetratricopeptide (TPR) repeat protein